MKFAHINIVSHDWKKLSAFYQKVFSCVPIAPERNLRGEWIENATGIKGVNIRGEHLRFPGSDSDGPTLEIFEYNEPVKADRPAVNKPGFAHIAFVVDDVKKVLDELIANGGSSYGDIASNTVNGQGTVTLVYAADPDGNIIELLNWR